ncbi:hypothetical protein LEP1GSC060_2344 [Leptospira weilii serovar Ranarum str. ICFT]|uniref:Uncharacterized protein n=1 Tax=Leptospira weilii serovar Ranarum str. ICFT TaxID=1218598 RepID=N1WQC1_9LEPT|nr:hypothetical protein LEP1GSC060_2344 [Leptospira weilii serovar Ranarum str. ICFT]
MKSCKEFSFFGLKRKDRSDIEPGPQNFQKMFRAFPACELTVSKNQNRKSAGGSGYSRFVAKRLISNLRFETRTRLPYP